MDGLFDTVRRSAFNTLTASLPGADNGRRRDCSPPLQPSIESAACDRRRSSRRRSHGARRVSCSHDEIGRPQQQSIGGFGCTRRRSAVRRLHGSRRWNSRRRCAAVHRRRLCLDGVEISTDGGHYIAVGAAASPYPLGGDSAGVVEDVARLGGFGVVAHPGSLRPELAWSDWTPPIDALEWLNADSEWRDESRWAIARAFASYPLRPPAALATLLDRPVATLKQWDSLAARARVLGLAGLDAHGGIGNRIEIRRGVAVSECHPTRPASERFSTRVELDRPFTGDARADGHDLVDMLKAGRSYSEIDAVASGAALEYSARTGEESVGPGSVLHGAGTAVFRVRAANVEGASTVAFRNGVGIGRAAGTSLDFQSAEPGSFRIEIHVANAPGTPPVPWVVSNPIFRFLPAGPAQQAEPSPLSLLLQDGAWRVEKSEGSDGTVRVTEDGGVEFAYRLRPGPPASQFAALTVESSSRRPRVRRSALHSASRCSMSTFGATPIC